MTSFRASRVVLLLALFATGAVLADTVLRNKGSVVGPVRSMNCGIGMDCTRDAGVGTFTPNIALDGGQLNGVLPVARGGTNGTAAPIDGGLPYGAAGAFAWGPAGAAGSCLKAGGAGPYTFGVCSYDTVGGGLDTPDAGYYVIASSRRWAAGSVKNITFTIPHGGGLPSDQVVQVLVVGGISGARCWAHTACNAPAGTVTGTVGGCQDPAYVADEYLSIHVDGGSCTTVPAMNAVFTVAE